MHHYNTLRNAKMESGTASDDDLCGLFNQVADKLGWKSDQDLDDVINELSQSTKKKKRKKKEKRRADTLGQMERKRTERKIKGFGRTVPQTCPSKTASCKKIGMSKHCCYPENAQDQQTENKQVDALGTSEDGNVFPVNTECHLGANNDKEKVVERSASPTSPTCKGIVSCVNAINDKVINETSDSKSETRQSGFVQEPYLSFEDPNDSVDKSVLESPLPRCINFGDTPDKARVIGAIGQAKETSDYNEAEDTGGNKDAAGDSHTPQRKGKITAQLSETFSDSPEPMKWLMSPPPKSTKPLEPALLQINSSGDKDKDDVLYSEDVAEGDGPERILSLTERLAQNHKKAQKKDDSHAKKQRRRSCANPRSKSLIRDDDWADHDDENDDAVCKQDDNDDNGDVDDGDVDDIDPDNNERKNGDSFGDGQGKEEIATSIDGMDDRRSVEPEITSSLAFAKPRTKHQDSSSDDDFESFLNAIKTPHHSKESGRDSDSDEVVVVMDDDDFIDDTPLKSNSDDDDDDDVFYLKLINSNNPLSAKNRNTKHPKIGSRSGSVLASAFPISDEDDEDVFELPRAKTSTSATTSKTTSKKTTSTTSKPWRPLQTKSLSSNLTDAADPSRTDRPAPTSKPRRPLQTKSLSSNLTDAADPSRTDRPAPPPPSFLRSLSTPGKGVQARSRFVSDFKRHKEELVQRLFKLYNETVFENKLPADFSITWNNRMRKTAGFCFYKKRLGERTARIELSVKVCDSAERLRDTLIHELCHAASWLVHGVSDGHGKFWKYWAAKANLAHPEIPVIKRCHTYEIHTKYKYKCVQCGNIIGRHSKSVDTVRFACGLCSGRLELQPTLKSDGTPARPRGPNPFAAFVKENYASVKKAHGAAKHAEVMKLLSQEFSSKAKISKSEPVFELE